MVDSLPRPDLPQKPVPQAGGGGVATPSGPGLGRPPLSAPLPGQPPQPRLSPSPVFQPGNAPILPRPPQAAGGPVPAGGFTRPAGGPLPTGGAIPGSGQSAVPAQAKGSLFKFLPLILGVLVLVGVIGLVAARFLGGGSQPLTDAGEEGEPAAAPAQTIITYWGLWEPDQVLSQVLDDFSQQNPGVIVQYKKQSHLEYRERLQAAIAAGSGPDVFRFHASWTPMLKGELDTMPASVMSASEYTSTFYPVVAKQLQVNSKVVGVPLMYDGLALYYNQQALATAAIDPPRTWTELRQAAVKLTIRSGSQIQRAGLAAGNSTNVDHFSDILGLLMLQNGADLAEPTSKEATEALTFYTDFVKKDQVWDSTLPNSTVAFARGDVAMIFAPSWRVHEIRQLNPDLEFATVPVPKLAGAEVAWASYWAEGVSSQSKNKAISWKLLKYLSSREVQQKLYSDQSQTRAFGEIYSRQDLADELATTPYVQAYLSDAAKADSWYLNSFTHDNGINDQLIKYYQDAVTAILSGKNLSEVTQTLNLGTSQVLRQYGVSSPAATTTATSSTP